MAITRNPYGVGVSGDYKETRYGRCPCCGLPFSYVIIVKQPHVQERCDDCSNHFQVDGEANDRIIARLKDHEQRMRSWAERASAIATRNELKVKQEAGKVGAALASRDRWRDLAAEVYQAHLPKAGKCSMCGQKHPCRTMRLFEQHGQAIISQLEGEVRS